MWEDLVVQCPHCLEPMSQFGHQSKDWHLNSESPIDTSVSRRERVLADGLRRLPLNLKVPQDVGSILRDSPASTDYGAWSPCFIDLLYCVEGAVRISLNKVHRRSRGDKYSWVWRTAGNKWINTENAHVCLETDVSIYTSYRVPLSQWHKGC